MVNPICRSADFSYAGGICMVGTFLIGLAFYIGVLMGVIFYALYDER